MGDVDLVVADHDPHRNRGPVDQRRPVADDVRRPGAALVGQHGDPGHGTQDPGHDLDAEAAVDLVGVVVAHRQLDHDLARLGVGERRVGGVPGQELGAGVLVEVGAAGALPHELRHLLGLGQRVGPGDDEPAEGPVAVGEADRHLELLGGRLAHDAAHLDPVGAVLGEADGVEAGDAVGGQVLRGAHLVEELLADRVDADEPARPRMLGDGERAVGGGLDEGEAEVGEALHLLPVGEVPTGALGAALDDVAGHDAGGEPVPVVGRPAELVDHRRQGHAGVGHPAGDDHVGAHLQRLHHRGGAEVDVGREHVGPLVGQGPAGVHVGQRLAGGLEVVEAVEDVVAEDDADPDPVANAELVGQLLDGRLARQGVHAAGVGDDLDAPLGAGGQHVAQLGHEVGGVARLRFALALLLEDGHGHLGEVVHDEVVDRAPLHLAAGGGRVVSPEAAAVGDDDSVRGHVPFPSRSVPRTDCKEGWPRIP